MARTPGCASRHPTHRVCPFPLPLDAEGRGPTPESPAAGASRRGEWVLMPKGTLVPWLRPAGPDPSGDDTRAGKQQQDERPVVRAQRRPRGLRGSGPLRARGSRELRAPHTAAELDRSQVRN